MRILHFVETYHSLSETFVHNFIELSSNSAEVKVICFNKTIIFKKIPNVKIIELSLNKKSFKAIFLKICFKLFCLIFEEPFWYKDAHKIIKLFKPDLIHCHFGTTGVEFNEFAIRKNIKTNVLISFYGFDVSSKPNSDQKYKNGLTKLFKSNARFLAEGPILRQKIISLGASPDKVFICPLVLNSSKYDKRTTNKTKTITLIRFLIIGRFVEKKGFHHFFEAIGKMRTEMENFEITVIGDGPLKADYIETISKYGYLNKVNFLGFKNHEFCISSLASHDFFVHPSCQSSDGDTEGGAPTILLEAQLIGIPIISTTHCDIPYTMGYNDFLAEENNIESLIEIIKKAIEFKDLNSKIELGINFILQNHTYETSPYPKLLLSATSQIFE